MGRKPHVQVSQNDYLYLLRDVGGGELADFAAHFNVSAATARRKLDGLYYQGKVERRSSGARGPFYWCKHCEIASSDDGKGTRRGGPTGSRPEREGAGLSTKNQED